jgi:uncharacterized protein YqcC (DUF446 family)
MRNRELVLSKLDTLESNMNKLQFMVNRQSPTEDFLSTVEHSRDILEQLKSFIAQQPFSPDEMNSRN